MTTPRETENRTRRAMALVDMLRRVEALAELDGITVTPVEDMTDDQWAKLARAVWPEQPYVPSSSTRAMVIELMGGKQ